MIDAMAITGKTDIIRDAHSKAILSVDLDKLKDYNVKFQQAKLNYENSLKIDNMESDINNIKKDMDDIKMLLIKILDKD